MDDKKLVCKLDYETAKARGEPGGKHEGVKRGWSEESARGNGMEESKGDTAKVMGFC